MRNINLISLAVVSVLWSTGYSGATMSSTDDSKYHTFGIKQNKNVEYEDAEYWLKSAQDELQHRMETDPKIEKEAKNQILFLGDGWGITTLTAGRIMKGQQVDDDIKFGEEASLHVDTFPFTGLSKTFCSDHQTADSACTSTAYLAGTKANVATMGLTPAVKLGDCAGQQNPVNHVSTILAWAQAAGKSTGVVTTARVTHATPGGAYAHICNREWECDADIASLGGDPEVCDDIAEQLILKEPGKNINVIMGGGRSKFLPTNQGGSRLDGKNLIDTWLSEKIDAGLNVTVLHNKTELSLVNVSNTDYVLGLFAPEHLEFLHDRKENDQPTLSEMVEKAIQILSKNPNGFFLFVEGELIDIAHHQNRGQRALWEAIEFDQAVKKGDEMTSDQDTLIVATADHSHTLSIGGYATRGTSILGYATDILVADDGMKRTTLNYANGPGWQPFTGEKRHDVGKDDVFDIDYQQVPMIPIQVGSTHAGEDVGIFAKGPFAHYLTGVHNQNYIPHVMAFAACIGKGHTYCQNNYQNR